MRQRDLTKAAEKTLRGKTSNLDIIEVRIRQLLKQLSDSSIEIARLQNVSENSQSGVQEAVQAKEKEVEEKEKIIRRQQTLIKTKESAYQELQDAYTEQRREIEALKEMAGQTRQTVSMEPSESMDPQVKEKIKEHLAGILDKLERLETMQ